MAYDPVKAHEYYINYRKKGLKKGRKKGKGKGKTTKTPKSSLVGLGTAGLNDAGKMQWAMLKKELNEQMNAELDGVTDAAQRKSIIQKYQSQALAELQKMKADANYATPKKAKASSGGGSSKSSGGSSHKSSSSSKEKKEKEDEDDSDYDSSDDDSISKPKTFAQHSAEIKKKGALKKGKKVAESKQESKEDKINRLANDAISTLNTIINKANLQNATPDQREQIRTLTENIVQKLENSGAPKEVIDKISALREQIGV